MAAHTADFGTRSMNRFQTPLTLSLLLATLMLQAQDESSTPEPGKPLVVAQYYTWYGTPFGAAEGFLHWQSEAENPIYDKAQAPEVILFPPAIRQINSCAYPLIGTYDSMDREVVRWHIRLAKAAGIDAFLVDWWGPAGWQKPAGWTHDVFVNTVLPVAEEEDFKVTLFDETAQFVDDFDTVKAWTLQYLKQFKDSPAWLHIDGKPVWSVYQLWEGKLTAQQGAELIRETEAELGPVYWMVDRMRLRNTDQGLELFTPDDWLAIDGLDCVLGYAMFSTWRFDTYEDLAPLYKAYVEDLHAAGKKAMLPVHPGHDNRKINPEPYWMPRREGRTLRDFWRAAHDAGADLICITSFNEWPETTVVEPAMTWPDPYAYLRIVAEFQGRTFTPPPLPPPEHLDPAAAEYLRNLPAPTAP
jgi:hypothetical protein